MSKPDSGIGGPAAPRLTPEEKAVIEAAEQGEAHSHRITDCACICPACKAVRALHESRKPKPKWTTDEAGYLFRGGRVMGILGIRSEPEKIADLLNRAEQP